MNKKKASVTLMAIFIFAIISILALLLLSRIESKTITLDAQKDSIQSGYYSEALAHIAWDGIDEKVFLDIVRYGGNKQLKKPSFEGITADSVLISGRREKGRFTTFTLSTFSTYKGIQTAAHLTGSCINPIFYREDGILAITSLENKELLQKWIVALDRDPTAFQLEHNASFSCKKEATVIYEQGWYHIQALDETVAVFNPAALSTGIIGAKLKLQSPMEMKGLLIIDEDAEIEGIVRVEGVCIRKSGSKINGKIICDGLVIADDTQGIQVNFNPRTTEKVLLHFPGFVSANHLRLKKQYGS